jgi:autotransporter-associated beta strand protein
MKSALPLPHPLVPPGRRIPGPIALLVFTQLLVAAALTASAATVNWTHATGDRNWSTTGNWTGGLPAPANDVIFNNVDAQTGLTPVNTVDGSVFVKSLSYTNANTSGAAYTSYQNTLIGSGQTLTVTNGLNVGVGDTTGYSADAYTYASITGAGGTLSVTGGNVSVGNQALATSPSKYAFGILDMRGLDNFNFVSPAGTFYIAGLAHPRQGGTVYLAGTNSIAASAISLGIIQQNLGSFGGILHLGQSNNLFADTVIVGKLQRTNLVDFQTGLVNPTARIRARDGVHGVGSMYLGWNANASTSSSHATGTNDFSGGIVDALITNLYVGYYNGVSSSSFTARLADGAFILSTNGQNRLAVQNLYLGSIVNPAAVDTPSSTGVLDARGGTITADSVVLAQQVVATSTARGTIKLTGGTMTVGGDIAAGGGTSTVIVSNATLSVGGVIGSASQYLSSLTLSNGATAQLTLLGGTNATVFTTNFTVYGACTISVDAITWSAGQFPLVAYVGSVKGLGLAGLTLQTPPGVVASLVNNTAKHTVDVLVTDTPGIKWSGAVDSVWDISGKLNWTKNGIATNYSETAGTGPQVFFDDTAASAAVNLAETVDPDGVVLQNVTKTYTLSGTGKLSGGGSLSKQGAGTVILANSTPNDYAGITAVSAGTLQVGNGGTDGSLGAGGVLNNATVIFNRSDALVVSGPVSGSGTLQQQGAGVVQIPNVTSYSGPIVVSAGVLALGSSASLTPSGAISGSGSFGVAGGTVILTNNADNYAGGSVIYSGTLQVGDGSGNGVLPAGAVTNNGALVFNLPSTLNVANNISGAGSVSSVSGDLILSGANTHSGVTTRLSGNLIAGSQTGFSPNSAILIGDTNGAGLGTLDCGSYSPVIGGLAVGGNSLFSMSALTLGGSHQTLTINGSVAIGNAGATTTGGLSVSSDGTGSIVVNTNGGFIQLGLNASSVDGTGQPNNLTVDLSGLASFSADLGAAGNFWVGELNTHNRTLNTGVTPYNVLTLAGSNTVRSGTLSIGAGGRGFTPEVHLGGGPNTLNADVINLGIGMRDSARLVFASGAGSVTIRGYAGGNSRAALNLGTRAAATTTYPADNTVDFGGHNADVRLSTMILGDQAARAGAWTETFTFDQGALDVTSVDLSRSCLAGTPGVSTLNLHGGTATIGSLTFMRNNTAASATATVDIGNGAVVTVVGDVLKGATAGTANINMSSGTLNARGRIGTAAVPISSVTMNAGTLNVEISGTENPATAPVQIGSFQPNGATLSVNGTGLRVGQFPVIAYGALGGGGFGGITLANPPGIGAYLSNNVAASTIDLVVTDLNPLVWDGVPNGDWDIGTTANWQLGGSSASYSDGSRVLFNDSASGATSVNLTTALNPAAVNFDNSAKDYVLSGSGRLTGNGGLAKLGSGTVRLANGAANDYTGVTTIGGGALLVNGTIGSGAVNVQAGVLGGTGVAGGLVSVAAGGAIAPGDGGIGMLTVSNSVTLAGTALMEINKTAGTSDQLAARGTLNYGGVLQVTNLDGALRGGESFKLFDAAVYRNAFASLVPATPGTGLAWDTSRLAVDGTLKVIATFTPATNVNIVKIDATTFQLTGNGGPGQAYNVWAQTNVAAPMTNWWVVGSTNADSAGVINFVDPHATNAQQFYRFGQ